MLGEGYKVRLGDNFKGVLSIPAIGFPLERSTGQFAATLDLEQFQDNLVQVAIKKGFLVLESQPETSLAAMVEDQKPYEVLNASEKILAFEGLESALYSGDTAMISERTLLSPTVQQLLQSGHLQWTNAKDEAAPKKRGRKPKVQPKQITVRGKKQDALTGKSKVVSKTLGGKKTLPMPKIQMENEAPLEPQQGNMVAWDGIRKKILNKNQSEKEALSQHGIEKMEIQKGDVDFSDDDAPQLQTSTGSRAPKRAAGRQTPKKKGGLQPVGRRKVAGQSEEDDGVDFVYDNDAGDDVAFVDQQQNYERMKKHPKLREKMKKDLQRRLADLNGEVG